MMTTSTDRIEKHIFLKAKRARVWRAISNHEEFGQWFKVKMEGPFVPGKPVSGQILYPGFEHLKMTVHTERVEPESVLAFKWHPHAIDQKVDYSKEPMTVVTFTLAEKDGGTQLSVVETGFDSVPAERRATAFRANEGGWAEQLKNIEAHVAHG